jgi:predicted nucleic acid-binding protein
VEEAARETEELLSQFRVLYPDDDVVRGAISATLSMQLSWFDAVMWAYAETNGLTEIISEDFQHDRRYGHVRAVNPFFAM